MADRVVHKYAVGYGEARAYMPPSAKVIHVAILPSIQEVFVWAEVEPGEDLEARQIGYFATGGLIPEGAVHVGTAITPDGAFVWHVYEGPAV